MGLFQQPDKFLIYLSEIQLVKSRLLLYICFTLLRRKPRLRAEAHFGAQARFFRPWMNAMRVPYEALEERSGVCFGGFRLPARSRFGEGRPSKHVEEPRVLARGGSTNHFSKGGANGRGEIKPL